MFSIFSEPKHSWGSHSSEKWEPHSQSYKNGLNWYRIDSNPRALGQDPYKKRIDMWDEFWPSQFIEAESSKNAKTEL